MKTDSDSMEKLLDLIQMSRETHMLVRIKLVKINYNQQWKILNHRWIIADLATAIFSEVLLKYFVNDDESIFAEVNQSLPYPKYTKKRFHI
jgi:hypothetical protein